MTFGSVCLSTSPHCKLITFGTFGTQALVLLPGDRALSVRLGPEIVWRRAITTSQTCMGVLSWYTYLGIHIAPSLDLASQPASQPAGQPASFGTHRRSEPTASSALHPDRDWPCRFRLFFFFCLSLGACLLPFVAVQGWTCHGNSPGDKRAAGLRQEPKHRRHSGNSTAPCRQREWHRKIQYNSI